MVGPKKKDFWQRINILQGFSFQIRRWKFIRKGQKLNFLLKPIFDVKNQPYFIKKNHLEYPPQLIAFKSRGGPPIRVANVVANVVANHNDVLIHCDYKRTNQGAH